MEMGGGAGAEEGEIASVLGKPVRRIGRDGRRARGESMRLNGWRRIRDRVRPFRR